MTDLCAWCVKSETSYKVFLADDDFSNEKRFVDDDGTRIRACEECAREWSGHIISRDAPNSPEFRIVMEHDDFEQVTLKDVKKLALNMPCRVCGEQIAENLDDAYAISRRMLRLVPEVVLDDDVEEFFWTCGKCGRDCPDCKEGDEDHHHV